MQDFKKLVVWQKAHLLTLAIYKVTATFPKDELHGLTSQIRRSCASIPANIAEGCGRDGKIELKRFLQIALGSATELEYHLLLALDLKFLNPADYKQLDDQVSEIRKMLIGLTKKLKEIGG
jgi:four helix bundle protein